MLTLWLIVAAAVLLVVVATGIVIWRLRFRRQTAAQMTRRSVRLEPGWEATLNDHPGLALFIASLLEHREPIAGRWTPFPGKEGARYDVLAQPLPDAQYHIIAVGPVGADVEPVVEEAFVTRTPAGLSMDLGPITDAATVRAAAREALDPLPNLVGAARVMGTGRRVAAGGGGDG